MTPLDRCQSVDPEHWFRVHADVCTQAAVLIPSIHSGGAYLGQLRAAIADFHECHVMALVNQLAMELAAHGLDAVMVRDQLLADEISRIAP